MEKGTIIERVFTRQTSTGFELRYSFRTYEFILNRQDELDAYLATCFEIGIPDFEEFESPSQCSTPIAKIEKVESDLIALALAADYRGKGRQQHEVVQNYLMEHDPHMIAMEVPLYMFAKETPNKKHWVGHLDILRVFPDKYQIVDFKPKANKEKKAGSQLLRYMLMFQKRTGIPFDLIEGIYFDDMDAYKVTF